MISRSVPGLTLLAVGATIVAPGCFSSNGGSDQSQEPTSPSLQCLNDEHGEPARPDQWPEECFPDELQNEVVATDSDGEVRDVLVTFDNGLVLAGSTAEVASRGRRVKTAFAEANPTARRDAKLGSSVAAAPIALGIASARLAALETQAQFARAASAALALDLQMADGVDG